MNKREFIKEFSFANENMISNIYDKMTIAKKTGKNVYTQEFYTPNIWSKIENMTQKIGLKVVSYGIFENADRRCVMFSENYEEQKDFPVDLIKISAKSKFSKLKHKDYLGALMSLGLRREKFGDLLVKGGEVCYLACMRDISEYIKLNFNKVGNSNCSVDILDLKSQNIPDYEFKSFTQVVSSMRLDCIVSSICKVSRNDSDMLIKKGKVQVNYFECKKKNMILDCKSTITVRGYGKFKLIDISGFTARGRIKLLVEKFS
ncbi:RNA-binding protein [Clostridium sp. cel8]|jgi:RNA-binding protein YlmH|uniref:YlmH family RNA-binding protein n=1 Tax=unclassified Clostridium TaxID=2614128 RepID=UPI0015F3A266|nr:YlmH/Sll1252 family protein [Clostridium sp. cel8]MBA5850647.1 RNA-binding protein [Clostridium sp. cel8]